MDFSSCYSYWFRVLCRIMNPTEAFHKFTCLKLHFSTESYDVEKYNWQVRGNLKFDPKQKGAYFYEKLARQYDPVGLMIANFAVNPKMFVGNLFLFDSTQRHNAYRKYAENLSYCFKEELNKLNAESFRVHNEQHPRLLQDYIRGDISIETMSILNDFIRYILQWDNDLVDDVVWTKYRLSILKFKPFIKYDVEKIKQIMKNWLTEAN